MIVKKSAETAQIDNINRLSAVEVYDAVWGEKSSRKIRSLAPMHAEAFAERKAAGAFQAGALGPPVYYTRTDTGIEFHPACDKDYWFELILNG